MVPIEYQVLPPMCKICQVFGHSTKLCAKKAIVNASSPKPEGQSWISVGNGKQKGLLQQPSSTLHQGQLLNAISDNHQSIQLEESSESEDEIQEGKVEAVVIQQQTKETMTVRDDSATSLILSIDKEVRFHQLNQLPNSKPPDNQSTSAKEKAAS